MNASDLDFTHLVQANRRFALDLYERLSRQEGSLFFSPYSLSAALAMTYAGARGETQRQMVKTLHFTAQAELIHASFKALAESVRQAAQSQGISLRLANSLWPQVQHPFREDFLALLGNAYAAQAEAVDYIGDYEDARKRINAWVEAQTGGMIPELLTQGILDDLTRLTLVNAIYFKGLWAHPFDPANTSEVPFWLTPRESVPAQMMHQTRSLRYAEADGNQLVELPYAGERLAMVALLPQKADRLDDMERRLPDRLERWLASLAPRQVSLALPRFRLDCAFRLDEALQSLGMKDAFSEHKANFAGMDGHADWLYIAAVVHQAVIEVNEQGSEAAAATAVVLAQRAMPQMPVEVRLDRPFLMLIWDKETQSILFLGRVNKP